MFVFHGRVSLFVEFLSPPPLLFFAPPESPRLALPRPLNGGAARLSPQEGRPGGGAGAAGHGAADRRGPRGRAAAAQGAEVGSEAMRLLGSLAF